MAWPGPRVAALTTAPSSWKPDFTDWSTGLKWQGCRAALFFFDVCAYRQRGWKIKSWHWNPQFICAVCTVCLNEMKPAQVSRFRSATYQLCILRKFPQALMGLSFSTLLPNSWGSNGCERMVTVREVLFCTEMRCQAVPTACSWKQPLPSKCWLSQCPWGSETVFSSFQA